MQKMSIELAKENAQPQAVYKSQLVDSNKAGLNVEGWKFALSPNLENGALSLAPEEVILYTWNYKSTALSQDEFITSILTFGIYYFITRIYKRRRRVYKIIITNNRVIIKEEMFESTGFCALEKQLIEDQVSYPLAAVRYICTEQIGEKFCGLFPPSVVLEIHFKSNPSWAELPYLSYGGGSQILKRAFINAFKLAYGIDLLAKALDKVKQIALNSSKLQYPHYAIIFAAYFGAFLLFEFLKHVASLLLAAYSDPIIGSYQVTGQLDAKVFRWEADTKQDPGCKDNVLGVLKALSGQFKKNPIIPSDVNPDLNKSVGILDSFDSFKPLNSRSEYGNYSGFNYYNNIFPLKAGDTIREIASDNPVFTWSDFWAIINSLGFYYFSDLHNKLTNWTVNYVVTDTGIIRQQIVLAPAKRTIQFARADVWLTDNCDFLYVIEGPKPFCGINKEDTNLFIAGSKSYSVELEIRSLEFGTKLLKYLTSKVEKYDYNLCLMYETADLANAPYTKSLIHSNETIDSSVKSSPKDPLLVYIANCGLNTTSNDVFTATSHGLYLETFESSIVLDYCQMTDTKRRVLFFSWSHVGAFYWSNYDSTVAGCCGRCNCCGCCDCEGDPFFIPHGYHGSRLRIQIDSESSFSFGIDIPRVYYAQAEPKLNAIVDTVSLRNYINSQRSLVTTV